MRVFYILPILSTALAAPAGSVDECSGDTENMDILEVNDGPTNDGAAGIGAEFESQAFYWISPGCSDDDTNAAKRKLVAGRQGEDWMLTADTGSGEAKLQAEYILDGQSIKVGTGQAKSAGEAVAADLIKWAPWKQRKGKDRVTLTVADNNCNPWYIDAPPIGSTPEGLPWNPQVTAPLPLEALYFLMEEQALENDLDSEYKNLIGGSVRYSGSQVLVTKDWFKSRPNGIDSTKVTDDVLAFCSIVLTYAKSATKPLKPDESPKLRSTFMPRTEINTLYKQVHGKIPGDIFNLFNTLACYKTVKIDDDLSARIDRDFCSGTKEKPQLGKKFSELEFSNPAACDGEGKMSVKSWIENLDPKSHSKDELSVFDESIDGSIGGLGSKMEKMWESDREVPLFEFRDLFDTTTNKIAQFMQTIDENIQSLHTKYKTAPSS